VRARFVVRGVSRVHSEFPGLENYLQCAVNVVGNCCRQIFVRSNQEL
jgi:hypothetical protein